MNQKKRPSMAKIGAEIRQPGFSQPLFGNPAVLCRTRGFASPVFAGFALIGELEVLVFSGA
jgi:hypothetical protein